jgi:hypothetical protein
LITEPARSLSRSEIFTPGSGRSTIISQGSPKTGFQRASSFRSNSRSRSLSCSTPTLFAASAAFPAAAPLPKAMAMFCLDSACAITLPTAAISALYQKLGEVHFFNFQTWHSRLQGAQQIFFQPGFACSGQ